MSGLFIGVMVAVVLQIIILFRLFSQKSHGDIELTGRVAILPDLIQEKLTTKLLEHKQQVLASLNELTAAMQHKFSQLQIEILERLSTGNEHITTKLQNELERINLKVEERLKEGFMQTTQTFSNILERLTKIDEAQKKIEQLSTDIVSLQDVLSDKKTRGIFGEVQLKQILTAVFGENNSKLYAMQYKLSNNTLADAILFTPEPLGNIAIDSKFPLENYRRMVDINLDIQERKTAHREFEINVKKHIDDIATKYILANETSRHAIMFIPAEAIFAEIHANHTKLLEYAANKLVWLASPTTLMASLTTIQVVMNNIEQAKYATIIQENLNALGEEFARYRTRWDNLARHIDTVSKDVHEIHTTTSKIGSKFDSISRVQFHTTENPALST